MNLHAQISWQAQHLWKLRTGDFVVQLFVRGVSAASRRQTTPGRTSDPLASSKVLRLPRNLRRCPADARRRQGVHPTPWQAAKRCACHEICAGAQPTPDDARACIRPLAGSKVPRLPRNLRRCPADARRRQGVHPTPWQAAKCCACHDICAAAQPTPDDARAYIRPLGKQQSAAPATKSAPVPSRRLTTPGRTSDPLASSKVLRLPRHEICAGAQPSRQTTPGRTSDPLATPWQAAGVLEMLCESCCVCAVVCGTLCVGCSLSDVAVERRTSDPLASDVV